MNAIGLQNPGIDTFVKRDIPFLKEKDTKFIVVVFLRLMRKDNRPCNWFFASQELSILKSIIISFTLCTIVKVAVSLKVVLPLGLPVSFTFSA